MNGPGTSENAEWRLKNFPVPGSLSAVNERAEERIAGYTIGCASRVWEVIPGACFAGRGRDGDGFVGQQHTGIRVLRRAGRCAARI